MTDSVAGGCLPPTPPEGIWTKKKGRGMAGQEAGRRFCVAIDGPAAAGKGTIGRAVASHFGFAHLDTGLLYRAVGMKVAEGADPVMAAQGLTAADLARPDLRSAEAAQAASRVAALPQVRAALVAFQRDFARRPGGAVLDGRDIGTVICPEAEVKLYVTASAEVRARRRWLEEGGDLARVLADVRERDARDMGRADAPLRPAADADMLDTTDMTASAAIARAIAVVEDALG
jgi:CMP/dCMP kinase